MKYHDPADQIACAVVDCRRRITDRTRTAVASHQAHGNATAASAFFIAPRVRQRRTGLVVNHAIDGIERKSVRICRAPARVVFRHRIHDINAAVGSDRDHAVANRPQRHFRQFLGTAQCVFAADNVAQNGLRRQPYRFGRGGSKLSRAFNPAGSKPATFL